MERLSRRDRIALKVSATLLRFTASRRTHGRVMLGIRIARGDHVTDADRAAVGWPLTERIP